MAGEFKLAEAFVELKAKGASTLKTQLSGVKAMATKLGSVFKSLGRKMLRAFSPIGLAIGGMLTVLSVKKILSLTAAQEQAVNDLESAIASSGQSTEKWSKKLQDVASSIQKITIYGDEALMPVMALGLNMGIGADKMEESTKAAIGLSKAFGIDLKTSMKMVALAMQGEFTLLQRYVPELRSVSTEAEKLAIFQKLVAAGFQQAQAETKTASGQYQQLKNELGDLGELVGKLLMPIFQGFGNIIRAVAEKASGFISGELPKLNEALSTVKAILDGIADGIRGSSFDGWSAQLEDAFKGAAEILMATIKAVGQFLLSIASTVGQMIGEGVVAAMASVGGDLGKEIARQWKAVKWGGAYAGAIAAGDSHDQAVREADAVVNSPKKSVGASVAGAARAAFGPGSELATVFKRLADQVVETLAPVVKAKPAKIEMPEQFRQQIRGVLDAVVSGARSAIGFAFRAPTIPEEAAAEAAPKPKQTAESGLRSFSGLWESLQNRMSKGEEEINKEQKKQTEVLGGIAANTKPERQPGPAFA